MTDDATVYEHHNPGYVLMRDRMATLYGQAAYGLSVRDEVWVKASDGIMFKAVVTIKNPASVVVSITHVETGAI